MEKYGECLTKYVMAKLRVLLNYFVKNYNNIILISF
jgi:hypothetical protein